MADDKKTRIWDWTVGAALAALAALVYFLSMANYAYPGESAHLQVVWRGLDAAASTPYPLMALFARPLGCGNAIAPVLGVLAVLLLYACTLKFMRRNIFGEDVDAMAAPVSRVAGAAAALVFLFTPAVRSAATHLEPRLFDAVWALLCAATLLAYVGARSRRRAYLFLVLLGALAAAGFCDTVLFAVLMPVAIFIVVRTELFSGRSPYAAPAILLGVFVVAVFVFLAAFGVPFNDALRHCSVDLSVYTHPGWVLVAVFATLPFVVVLFSTPRVYNEPFSFVQFAFQAAMSLVAIIAVATPLSPSSMMEKWGVPPVVTSAFAAFFAGHLVSYWWMHRGKSSCLTVMVVLAFALGFASLWSFFAFERDRGAFADAVVRRALDDMGERTWLVTDGLIDDHFLLEAARRGSDVTLVSLARDTEKDYLERLGERVREKGIGGSKNSQLNLSLSLGVLPFVQDWLGSDPTAPKSVAIWSAPDLWYSAGFRPVPEFLFFGADESRAKLDWSAWPEFDKILHAPKGWGSYAQWSDVKNPVDRLRLVLRRHLGLVANNAGVYLQDQGRDEEAFDFYERVLNEIDSDNVCSLFNEIELAGAKNARAVAKRPELERRLRQIADDKARRYAIWRLASYYGYIRNPDMFVRLGYTWARSGRPGDALAQIRRAIDFVPQEKQNALLNMMAALYASENDQAKSRSIYESVLAKDGQDHDALIGMMRLKLLEGDQKAALDYLQRATAASSDGGRMAQIELSMVSMMKGDLKGAKSTLAKLADDNPKDLQAWSLLAAVTMQLLDASNDKAEKTALMKDITDRILPTMEKQSTNPYDYYLQTTKAFVYLRGGEEKRRLARDAFASAARARPDSVAAQDMMLGLDISLDDKVGAEHHAREVLRRNRNAPLANYVMGSLAIGRGQYDEAEAYLRKAADAPQPNVLALNDLAEVLRRTKKFDDAERYARLAAEKAPEFYIVWETLGTVLMDAGKDAAEAENCIAKAIELQKKSGAKVEDVRMYVSLARAQLLRGDKKAARLSVRKVRPRVSELNDFERGEFEEIEKRVK